VLDESNTGLGEPTIGPGDAGEYSREPGNLSYLEVKTILKVLNLILYQFTSTLYSSNTILCSI
jgi:hypothetical protein